MKTFLGIVGLPRSGTTLLTALLDAHPHIVLFYEPWNSSRERRPQVPEDLDAFVAAMERRFGVLPHPAPRIVGFKETSILPGAREWALETLDRVAANNRTRAIWIYRDPIHCLLSKLDGARRWWGYPDARLTCESLESHLHETTTSIAAFLGMARRIETLLVQYDALVADPAAVLSELLGAIGEDFDPVQLDYHRAGPQPERVMGDVSVAREPRPVSDDGARRREAEAREHAALIDEVAGRPAFEWLLAECRRLSLLPGVASPLPSGSHAAAVGDPTRREKD